MVSIKIYNTLLYVESMAYLFKRSFIFECDKYFGIYNTSYENILCSFSHLSFVSGLYR